MTSPLDLVSESGPLLMLAVVLLAGMSFGAAARRIGLPGVTGQILAGVLIGHAGLGLFDANAIEGLQPLTQLALGLIAVTVGAHLNVRRLRNAGRRLFFLLVTEATIVPALVYLGLRHIGGAEPDLAMLLAAAAVATAPATIVAVVKETRSKGVFVKTLIAAVALNNMACIVLFEGVRAIAGSGAGGPAPSDLVGGPVGELIIAAALGAAVALTMDQFARVAIRPDRLASGAVISLVFTSGLASALGVSPLLACLVLGIVQTNIARSRSHLLDSVFADFEPTILAIFFTLAGMHLSFEHIYVVGLIAFSYFVTRIVGKIIASRIAMRFAGATMRVRRNLGLALIPQAGVAVGLVIVIQGEPAYAHLAGLFSCSVRLCSQSLPSTKSSGR